MSVCFSNCQNNQYKYTVKRRVHIACWIRPWCSQWCYEITCVTSIYTASLQTNSLQQHPIYITRVGTKYVSRSFLSNFIPSTNNFLFLLSWRVFCYRPQAIYSSCSSVLYRPNSLMHPVNARIWVPRKGHNFSKSKGSIREGEKDKSLNHTFQFSSEICMQKSWCMVNHHKDIHDIVLLSCKLCVRYFNFINTNQ